MSDTAQTLTRTQFGGRPQGGHSTDTSAVPATPEQMNGEPEVFEDVFAHELRLALWRFDLPYLSKGDALSFSITHIPTGETSLLLDVMVLLRPRTHRRCLRWAEPQMNFQHAGRLPGHAREPLQVHPRALERVLPGPRSQGR